VFSVLEIHLFSFAPALLAVVSLIPFQLCGDF